MEKLFYAVWRPDDESVAAFCRTLLDLPAPLERVGAMRLRIGVPDVAAPGIDPYAAMRAGAPSGFVSFWLNSSTARGGVEAVLAAAAPHLAGYSVLESTVLPVTATADGTREAGFLQVCGFASLPHLPRAAFLDAWLNYHTAVAVQTQATTFYNQNIVVRPLTHGAPAWDAIVEERFPDSALESPEVYYAAVGDAARLAAHQGRMAESCARFIDFSTIKLMNCAEYRFGA